jgi:murein DD-endopeptidase MepM/ murein hydrolase activator NlpD
MRWSSVPARWALVCGLAALALALLTFTLVSQPVEAQETADPATADPSGGLDPVTTPAPLPTMQPYTNPQGLSRADGVTVELYFAALLQGTTGLVRVYGENPAGSPLAGVRARWQNLLLDFYTVGDGRFYGLVAAGMETDTGDAPLDVFLTYADGSRSARNLTIPIGLGSFIYQDVNVPADRAYLLDVETERSELSRLESLIAPITLERRWGMGGFQLPIPSALTSPFGAFRTFNSALSTRHTGWDIRVGAGMPVGASAGGRVVYTGELPIRGSYVMLDHGYGVYTGYAHLSDILVERGDVVERGQVLGATGATGRVSGAHFHWEVAVDGVFVDGVQFIQMWQP